MSLCVDPLIVMLTITHPQDPIPDIKAAFFGFLKDSYKESFAGSTRRVPSAGIW